MNAKVIDLRLEKIVADPRVQSRAGLNDGWVESLRERLKDGAELNGSDGKDWPVCFQDGKGPYILARGFHRREAHVREGRKTMLVEVRPGTMRDAILESVSSNVYHGAPLTNEDKNHAVSLLLADPEWKLWSNREIARRCGVSHAFVGYVRERLVEPTGNGFQLTKGADGKERDVSGISMSNIVRRLAPEVRETFEGLPHEQKVMLLDGIKEEMREEAEEKKQREAAALEKAARETDWRAARNGYLDDALDACDRIAEPTARDIQVRKDLKAVMKLTKTRKKAG